MVEGTPEQNDPETRHVASSLCAAMITTVIARVVHIGLPVVELLRRMRGPGMARVLARASKGE